MSDTDRFAEMVEKAVGSVGRELSRQLRDSPGHFDAGILTSIALTAAGVPELLAENEGLRAFAELSAEGY